MVVLGLLLGRVLVISCRRKKTAEGMDGYTGGGGGEEVERDQVGAKDSSFVEDEV